VKAGFGVILSIGLKLWWLRVLIRQYERRAE
jgi:hypothetical protein